MKIKLFPLQIQLLLALFFAVVSNAQNVRDFVVNDSSGGIPSLDVDNQGNMHIVWSAGKTMYAVFDPTGEMIIPPKDINPDEICLSPSIQIKNNFAAIAWESLSFTFNSYIYAKVINIFNDTIYSTGRLVNDSYGDAYRSNPDISFINDTTFVVVWDGGGPQVDGMGVYGQILTTSFNYIENNFFVSGSNDYNLRYGPSKVIGFPNHNKFFVAWRDNHNGNENIYGRFFNGTGAPQDSILLISDDDSSSMYTLSAAKAPNENFAVVWAAGNDSLWNIYWRWYDFNGTPLGPSEIVASENVQGYASVDISIDIDGKGIVCWEKRIDDYYHLYFKRFNPGRQFLDEELKLSSSSNPSTEYNPHNVIYNGKIYSVWTQWTDSTLEILANIIDFYNPPLAVGDYSSSEHPNSFQLMQNYPNPFNPATSISYNLPYEGMVTLKVCDILGNEIATLVNEVKPAGDYQTEFDASNLSSGVYIYTIKVNSSRGGFFDSKKMMVLK